MDTFLALLEYLYTDHAPIEEGDGVGILVLADEYCVPRLGNLCELYITKEVDRHCTKQIEKSDIDVVGLLNTAEVSNCVCVRACVRARACVCVFLCACVRACKRVCVYV